MRTKLLLSCLLVFLLIYVVQAQQMKPADPALRQRLMTYAAQNHLAASGMYMYWDSVTRKPYRFDAGNYTVANAFEPEKGQSVMPVSKREQTHTIAGITGNFHLIKDLNTATDSYIVDNSANYYSMHAFTTLNQVAYFDASDGIHGTELWRSDGTSAGTYIVKDIAAGEESSSPFNITASGSYVFFIIQNSGVGDYTLWKTDGTEAGTVPVKNFLDVAASPNYYAVPYYLCDVSGTLYFVISSNNFFDQLWKSDGTEAGTVLVKDFNAIGGSFIRHLVGLNGVLYFVGNDPTHGSEIWRSNGTDATTYLLKDISTRTDNFTGPSQLTPFGNKLYFAESDDGSTSNNLWATDGTTEGTQKLSANSNSYYLTNTSYQGLYPYDNIPFTISNSSLYFPASSTRSFPFTDNLYKYDTTQLGNGIQAVAYVNTQLNAGSIVALDSTVYFYYSDPAKTYLYATQGVPFSAQLVKSFPTPNSITKMTSGYDKLYFQALDTLLGYEPWTSDGTANGTVIHDISTGINGSSPFAFTPVNGVVLFSATDSLHGNELWADNGTNMLLLKDIDTISTSGSQDGYRLNMAAFNNGIITSAYTYPKGSELYSADPNSETLIKDIFAGPRQGYPSLFKVKNNIGYFIADIPAYGNYNNGTYPSWAVPQNQAIFKTDGTEAGTVQITPGVNTNIFDFVVKDDGTLIYAIGDHSTTNGKDEIWKSDGTIAGNTLLHSSTTGFFVSVDFNVNVGSHVVFSLVGNTVYFDAADNGVGFELWKSDGTPEGTVLVKDINPGYGSSSPSDMIGFDNQLFFSASDGTETALWKSDGTETGTVKVKSVTPRYPTVSNNTIFFSGTTAENGSELWKSDGTEAGTAQVKDINTGTGSSSPYNLTDVDGTLFFQASDSTQDIQLWSSDGTSAGTRLVHDMTKENSTYLSNFLNVTGKLFFIANGRLWLSDGISTDMVSDDALNGVSINRFINNGAELYLSAYNYQYGSELYAGDATQAVLPVSLLSFTAALKNTDVITQWQTATEVNTAYFNIQRSTDGIHFTSIGKVTAKGGSSTAQSYSYNDGNIANLVSVKTLYYRVQTVDKDGASSLSKVVPVDLNQKNVLVSLLPNPVKEVLKIRIDNYEGEARIELYDASGKTLQSFQQKVQSGDNITVNAASLQAGIYIAKLNLNGKIINRKFVKE